MVSGRICRHGLPGAGAPDGRTVVQRLVIIAIAAVAAMALTLASPARAVPAEDEAKAFIEGLASQAIGALTEPDSSREQKYERFRLLLRDHFAVNDIAEWVLGRHWQRATPAEQQAYLRAFEEWIIVTYVRRFESYSGETLQVSRALMGAGSPDVIVDSQIVRDNVEPVNVGWRVRDYDETLRIVDVFVEGVSMSQTQRADFASIIRRRGSVSGLIEEMQRVLSANN